LMNEANVYPKRVRAKISIKLDERKDSPNKNVYWYINNIKKQAARAKRAEANALLLVTFFLNECALALAAANKRVTNIRDFIDNDLNLNRVTWESQWQQKTAKFDEYLNSGGGKKALVGRYESSTLGGSGSGSGGSGRDDYGSIHGDDWRGQYQRGIQGSSEGSGATRYTNPPVGPGTVIVHKNLFRDDGTTEEL